MRSSVQRKFFAGQQTVEHDVGGRCVVVRDGILGGKADSVVSEFSLYGSVLKNVVFHLRVNGVGR